MIIINCKSFISNNYKACNYAHKLPFLLTGFVTEVYGVVVGTGQLPHYLPVVFIFSQPAVAGKPEGLVHGLIFHVNVLQVPTRSRACLQQKQQSPLWFYPFNR